jgi:hypothetical protein
MDRIDNGGIRKKGPSFICKEPVISDAEFQEIETQKREERRAFDRSLVTKADS